MSAAGTYLREDRTVPFTMKNVMTLVPVDRSPTMVNYGSIKERERDKGSGS